MSVWILVILLTGVSQPSATTIDGFPTEASCEAARTEVQGSQSESYLRTVCIELPWEDAGAMR